MSATIIEVPKTCKALPEPVAVLPHRVGDVITWGNVQPGTLVRLRDNREVLRWRECDAYGDDVAIMYPGRPCPGKVWKHGHKDRDITTEVADAALHKVRDITADISPCVVLGAGLSERMCAALAEVDDQPQRWAIANGYYGKVSSMPAGSAWTYPGGWGVTFAGGQVAWVNYDGDDLIRMSGTEVCALETRLEKCELTSNDLFVFGLALVYLTILAPFTTWLMKSGFDTIPREIEAAAMMDGANLFQTLRRITLPLAMPVVATSALFAFLLAWDEFFYALLFTSDQRAKTLTVTIADLAGGRIADYGLIATAGVLAALPPVFIGLVMQRALISGLTAGSVKG